MKNVIKCFLVIVFFCSSCSNDDSTPTTKSTDQYFRMDVDGTQIAYNSQDVPYYLASAGVKGDVFTVRLSYGYEVGTYTADSYTIVFDKEGNFLSFSRENLNGVVNKFDNFQHFPSNYFNLKIISIDESSKRIKATFSGKIYIDKLNLNSESMNVNGEFDLNYDGDESAYSGLSLYGIPQYCNANINGDLWEAKFERSYSPYTSFTAEDAYKIDIYFDQSTPPGSYDISPSSTVNYIKFSKFNTTTLTYDYYNVTGVLAYSYREYHGFTWYSFIGTFSFTAVNPNNPSDVIQVTDGTFRSFQEY